MPKDLRLPKVQSVGGEELVLGTSGGTTHRREDHLCGLYVLVHYPTGRKCWSTTDTIHW